MPEVIIGVDLGLRRDWTAIMAVERHLPQAQNRHTFTVIHLERGHWELPAVVDRAIRVVAEAQSQLGRDHVWLVLDRTGVGEFVPGPFRDAGLNPIPMSITGGHRPTFNWRSSAYPRTAISVRAEGTVPKRDLVGVLQVLLETDRLGFARALPDLDVLIRELNNFRAKISLSGNDVYEAWREGDHDDTVLATALACWFGERGLPAMTPRELTVRISGG